MTTAQDLMVGGAAGVPARLAVGSDTQVLTVTAGVVGWAAAPAGLTNPMTNIGDLIRGGSSGVPTRLAAVALGQVLISQGLNTTPIWSPDPAIRNLLMQGGTVGTSGVGVLAIGPSIAPTSFPVDTVQIYATDFDGEAGSKNIYIRDERGAHFRMGTKADGSSIFNIVTPNFTEAKMVAKSDATVSIGSGTNATVNFIQNNAIRLALSTDARIYGYTDIFTVESTCRTKMIQYANVSQLNLEASPGGGRDWSLVSYAVGGRGAGSLNLSSSVGGEHLAWDPNGEWFARMGVYGVKHVIADAPDTGGPGYRRLVVPN
jgi:hypothetical protein